MDLIDNIERWRYPRFFTDKIGDGSAFLSEEDFHHASKVLRLKDGDKLIVCDGRGTEYLCRYSDNRQTSIVDCQPSSAEPNLRLRLFQCLPKSDKMDFIVQKAVELGVFEIIPVVSGRCVSRPAANASNKTMRWNKIAYEAAKQCGRGIVPTVGEVTGFNRAVTEVNPGEPSILFYECGGGRLNEIVRADAVNATAPSRRLNLFIGSEGGFETGEVALAEEYGWLTATLGKRILRVDTASIAAISVIMNLTGNI